MSKIIVSWSIAYDNIMKFDDNFQNYLLPDQLDNLSISFLVKNLEKYPGGTAQNVAYNLGLLWFKNETVLLWAVGKDFVVDTYLSKYINHDYIFYDQKLYTATGNMIGDLQNNQIATFYIGAMDSSDQQSLVNIPWKKDYVIIMANQKSAMQKFLKESYDQKILSFFCPGQSLWLRSKEELLEASKYGTYLICNEYEIALFKKITWLDWQKIIALFDKVIVTLWEKWIKLCDKSSEEIIHGVSLEYVVDPTGAGDAFVGALVVWLQKNMSRKTASRFANVVASFVVEQPATMLHNPDISQIKQRFLETYQESLGKEF